MKKRSKNILITGVSTGIGYASSQEFLSNGYKVFGSVRRKSDAERLKAEFGAAFYPLIFDVNEDKQIAQAAQEVRRHITNEGLACLINNSGIAEGGPILYQPIEVIEKHFQVNVLGLIKVTKAFLPLLGTGENHIATPGKIINISSVSGKFAFPFVGAYVASKFAVEGFSHSLRRELLQFGIDVIILGPGSVQTPIWDKGIDMSKYADTEYGTTLDGFGKTMKALASKGLEPEDVAKKILKIYENKNPKTRYTIVKGYLQNWVLPHIIPDRMMDAILKKQMGL